MSDFLQTMARRSAERAAAARDSYSDADLDKPVVPLALGDFDIIAEIKNRSPSEGVLTERGRDRVQQAELYGQGGALAISVLTEPSRFGGELTHLEAVAARSPLPVMRKDFLVDTVQVLEARANGASGTLLIAAMLDDATLTAMLDCAFEHSLFVLLEAFDEDDLARCAALLERSRYADRAALGQLLVGVNTRNLRTLEVDGSRLARLAPLLPPGAAAVAESGLHTADDAAAVRRLGYRLALVGTALMRSPQPDALLRDMLCAGREA